MELLCVGSANQYAKRMARQTMWNMRKQSGDFTGHKKSLSDYVNITKASSILPQTDEADLKLSGILSKAEAGKKLSPDEWEYLRAKNPALYEKLREIEREEENYEKALKRCKTRDEAQRLHVSKLGEVLTAAKNGDESALYRLNRMTRTMTAFTESKEYQELPTEAEEAIERESERKAEQEALREEIERATAGKDAETVPEEKAETKSETVSKSKTGTNAEAVPGNGRKLKTEAIPGSGRHSKAEAVPKTSVSTGVRRTESARSADASRISTKTTNDTGNHAAAPGIAFGQRAYLNQRDEAPRRKTFHAKA